MGDTPYLFSLSMERVIMPIQGSFITINVTH